MVRCRFSCAEAAEHKTRKRPRLSFHFIVLLYRMVRHALIITYAKLHEVIAVQARSQA